MLAEAFADIRDALLAHPTEILGAVIALNVITGIVGIVPAGGLITVAVTPFLLAGTYIVISRAIDDTHTTRDMYIEKSKEKYIDTLVAYVLVAFVQGIVAAILGAVVVVVFIARLTIPENPEMLSDEELANQLSMEIAEALQSPSVLAVVLLFLVGYGLATAAIQFAVPAVILNDEKPVDGLVSSFSFLKENPLQIIGYSVVRGVLSILLVTAVGFAPLAALDGGSILALSQSPLFLISNALLTVPGTLLVLTLHTAYYRRLAGI